MPVKTTFYDQTTGEKLVRYAIDARECIERDPARYGLKPPPKKAVAGDGEAPERRPLAGAAAAAAAKRAEREAAAGAEDAAT